MRFAAHACGAAEEMFELKTFSPEQVCGAAEKTLTFMSFCSKAVPPFPLSIGTGTARKFVNHLRIALPNDGSRLHCTSYLRIFQVKTKGNPVWFERRNTDKINILSQRNIKMYSSVLSYRIEYVSMKE